jgi:hypothetical protein
MDSKIRIKMGQIEVEFEGTEEFLKTDLLSLLEKIAELYQKKQPNEGILPDEESSSDSESSKLGNVSITTIASKLKVKTGKELVIAACAYFTFVRGIHEFSRVQILKEMQEAKNYYQNNYSKNLTRYIQQLLTEDVVNETAAKKYSLRAHYKQKLEKELAN